MALVKGEPEGKTSRFPKISRIENSDIAGPGKTRFPYEYGDSSIK